MPKVKFPRLMKCLRLLQIGLLAILLLGALAWGINLSRRPPRVETQETIFRGVSYTRWVRSTPRPLVIHIVSVDLSVPGVHALVTPPDTSCDLDTCAMTTGEFARKYGVQVAINGSFFDPFEVHDYTLSDYYPHTGDAVNIFGMAISDGQVYSTADTHYANLCFWAGKAQIVQDGCPAGTEQALAGGEVIVQDGKAVDRSYDTGINPRSAAAVSGDGKQLWLVVVDGRQPWYSEGVTLNELAGYLVQLGAQSALNLDGGGSSTLVTSENRVHLLNSPIHTRIPMRERPVANQLGIFAPPDTLP
jgi:hypothetical protein